MTLMTEQAAVIAHLTAENAALKAEIAILRSFQVAIDAIAAKREQTQRIIYQEAQQ